MVVYELRPGSMEDFQFLYDLHVRTLKPHVERIWGWDDADQRQRFVAFRCLKRHLAAQRHAGGSPALIRAAVENA